MPPLFRWLGGLLFLVEAAGNHCLRQLDYSKYDFDFTIKNNSGATQRRSVSRTFFCLSNIMLTILARSTGN